MLRASAVAAAQVREAARLAEEAGAARLAEDDRPRAVVVLGLAARASPATCSRRARPGQPGPRSSSRGAGLPAWVGAADPHGVAPAAGPTETLVALGGGGPRGLPAAGRRRHGLPARRSAERPARRRAGVGRGRPRPRALVAVGPAAAGRRDALGLLAAAAEAIEATPSARAVADRVPAGRCEWASTRRRPSPQLAGGIVAAVVGGGAARRASRPYRFACQLRNAAPRSRRVGPCCPRRGHARRVATGRSAPRRRRDIFGDPIDEDEAPDPPARCRPGEDAEDGAATRPVGRAIVLHESLRAAPPRPIAVELARRAGGPGAVRAGPRWPASSRRPTTGAVYLALALGLDPRVGASPSGSAGRRARLARDERGGGTKAIVAALGPTSPSPSPSSSPSSSPASSSMLAESVHSFADSGNQVLLLVGGRRAPARPTPEHPFGYGRDRYFYAFLVALDAVQRRRAVRRSTRACRRSATRTRSTRPLVAIGILVFAIVLEGFSFRTAIAEARRCKGADSWSAFIRHAKTPELPVVLLEDFAALIGLVLALLGVGLAVLTGNAVWDGVGTLAIGVLLVAVAVVLVVEMKSLLLGEGAPQAQVSRDRAALAGRRPVDRVIHLRTMHLGPDELLVAAKMAMPAEPAAEVARAIDAAEARVRAAVPVARVIYLEPDLDRRDLSEQV